MAAFDGVVKGCVECEADVEVSLICLPYFMLSQSLNTGLGITWS